MTTKPSATPPEFNRELVAKAIATGTNPNSFEAKMLGVYELTAIATKQTERKYEKIIKEAWGHEKSVMESDSLDARIQKHSQFNPNQANAITEHYKAILVNLSRLRVEFAKIKIDDQGGKTAPALKDAIDLYLKKDSYSQRELTAAIPIFFALQYHAWEPRRVRIVVVPIELNNERAAMKDFSGSIRTSIQRQSGGQVVAA